MPHAITRETHPRPRFVRSAWRSLDGEWEFRLDPQDAGGREGWWRGATSFEARIVVPFPPESPASGIHDPGPHRVLWYRRTLTQDDLDAAGDGERVLLHFGAVDYRADVWVDGVHVARHVGGHTPFTADLTASGVPAGPGSVIVVRAEDDAADTAQPRGKQDWRDQAHVIWYDRTSGIWQPVWLERTASRAIESLEIAGDVVAGTVTCSVRLSAAAKPGDQIDVELRHEGALLARARVDAITADVRVVLELPALRNGQAYEELLWSPEHPRLIDAIVALRTSDESEDVVLSYLGLRSVGWSDGAFLLNDRPHRIRAVLAQNFWPQSHLAAPSPAALRREVELALELGFTTARVHQKAEDPRFLYWADRLGLLLWAEAPSAYDFSAEAMRRTIDEWVEIVARDRSNPSVVVWVPLNESWGIQHVSHDPRQHDFAEAMYRITRALDTTRPVVSNDGWEHAGSDLLTIHDYTMDAAALARPYADAEALDRMVNGIGPAGRRLLAPGARMLPGTPIVVSEFGGITFSPDGGDEGEWGYATADSAEAFEAHLRALITAVEGSAHLAGWCYTQLTDTMQEANGLLDASRRPKLPLETLRSIIRGA